MNQTPDMMMGAREDSVNRPSLFSTRKLLLMASVLFAFLFPCLTWKQAAACSLLLLLLITLILPWLDVDMSKGAAIAEGIAPARRFDAWMGVVYYPLPFWRSLSSTVTTCT